MLVDESRPQLGTPELASDDASPKLRPATQKHGDSSSLEKENGGASLTPPESTPSSSATTQSSVASTGAQKFDAGTNIALGHVPSNPGTAGNLGLGPAKNIAGFPRACHFNSPVVDSCGCAGKYGDGAPNYGEAPAHAAVPATAGKGKSIEPGFCGRSLDTRIGQCCMRPDGTKWFCTTCDCTNEGRDGTFDTFGICKFEAAAVATQSQNAGGVAISIVDQQGDLISSRAVPAGHPAKRTHSAVLSEFDGSQVILFNCHLAQPVIKLRQPQSAKMQHSHWAGACGWHQVHSMRPSCISVYVYVVGGWPHLPGGCVIGHPADNFQYTYFNEQPGTGNGPPGNDKYWLMCHAPQTPTSPPPPSGSPVVPQHPKQDELPGCSKRIKKCLKLSPLGHLPSCNKIQRFAKCANIVCLHSKAIVLQKVLVALERHPHCPLPKPFLQGEPIASPSAPLTLRLRIIYSLQVRCPNSALSCSCKVKSKI